MKKNLLIIISILLLLLVFSGCIVDRTKALITFYNQTDEPITKIKVGTTAYCGHLYGGGSRNIWLFIEGSGEPSAEECESFSVDYKGDTFKNVKIKLDWHYRFTILENGSKKIIQWEAFKTGYDLSDDGPHDTSDLYE